MEWMEMGLAVNGGAVAIKPVQVVRALEQGADALPVHRPD